MNVRRTCVLLLLCLVSLAPVASAASANIVISQVYGGGGSGTAGTAYTNDYVELYNTSAAAVAIGGWSLQYGSSTGQFGSSSGNIFAFPAGTTIPAGRYLLVKLGAPGTAGATFTADFTSTGLSMAAGSGKVALVTSSGALGCGATATPCTLPHSSIVDSVAYGASNNGEGGTTVNNGVGLNSTNGAIRKSDGCQDTDNNRDDFFVATVAGGLVPRTSASSHTCGVSNLPPSINAPADPIVTVAQDAAPFTVTLTGTDDGGIYAWSATAGTGVASVNVTAGQGTPNATYTVALQAGFSGQASFSATLSDTVNAAATRTVNVAVTPTIPNNAPSINAFANPVATVAQDAAPFNVSLSGLDDNDVYNWSATPGTGVSSVSVASGQGTANVVYSVTLTPGFSGTASFTASLSDTVNAAVTSAVTITVTPAPPPPLDHIVISQIYGGGGNSGAAFQNDFIELYNPTTAAVDLGGWTVQYASATGTGLWQPQPLGGIMQPGEYYLISLATNGTIGSVLPAPNVSGSLNMSGTNGKVALVRSGDALEGCPIGDPMLVDLVGYGTTANCREGATNAPTASNATSLFRKNGGFTDTNVNGSDFVSGTPNPRRTTPIVEIGPYVLSTDPRNNATTAPRDANITVNFTEAVDVTGTWFNIACAATGLHNDATIGGSGSSWIIVPNVNFQPGEVCSVTIFKDSIHDQDLDDSGINSDTLTADYTWSFSVATGTAPAYGPEVHLTMGNPTGAEADLNTPENFLMVKPELTLSYNRDRGTPNWVSWHLDDTWVGTLARVDTFRADPAVPADWYRVLSIDYFGSGFDRGHMVPNADRDPATSMPINQATFLMTNMIPQAPDNNQGPWANMENYLRTLLPANELYIVAGGSGTGGTGSSGFMTTFANGHVTVPALTWKVALVLPKDSGDDVSRVTAAARTIAVIMPNTQGIRNVDWQSYIVSVDQVEALTGYDVFANVADAVENSIEAGVNGVNPPGVDDQSISLNEDDTRTFTLESVSANENPLTYTIVSGPEHGTLSGSGASQTYTPAPDFNGTDTFTFRVSDGALTSNVGTMTITVLEVNDAPVAAADAGNTLEDTPVQFTAAELTANDTAGPSDENGQTLSISEVTATAGTNGSVTFDAGVVTYTPAPNFHGTASFTYSVCDNGITGGLTSPLCSTSTVTVNVASVNDAPVITTVSGPTVQVPSGTATTLTVTFGDNDQADTHTATFSWGDGSSSTATCTPGSCTASKSYAAAGIYTVGIVITDAAGATATTTFSNVIVFDTNAGHVTGGGWFATTTGKANLNVNVKYLPGQSAPAGNTKFEGAGITFTSTTHQWLVVSGSTAVYRGTGTINGTGNYGFNVIATDAATDTFRIRIWDTTSGTVVYDSTDQPLGGGNLVVHKG
ncbi:MAG TPA: DNA/RNA non-specific endonuclease, partial [Thermoanaerobaculia bacterium]|nr:DNA/RNA non-specific endonuclease [Thermoanaerobaculia bacterium]